MMAARYALIRYIADPVRNEALNVGIIAWSQHDYRFAFDAGAARRVVQDNPHLAKDALVILETELHRQLAALTPFSEVQLLDFMASQNQFPLELTEPRHTTVETDRREALDATFERLLQRLVHPRRRSDRTRSNPVQTFAREFQPLIRQRLIEPNHVFASSRTGIRRVVDFYANSGVDLALDALRLRFKEPNRIIEAADHEAFKVGDIRHGNSGVQFVVYCTFLDSAALTEANGNARRIIESSGATVMESIRETAHIVTERVRAHQ